MNNIRRRTLAISAILAVTLVVGLMLAAIPTTTPSAFAAKRDNAKRNDNTDPDTIQKCKQFGSGLDPTFGDQNCEILRNSTIGQAAAAAETPPEETGCDQAVTGFVALYDVTLDQDLGGVHVAGNELCLSGDGLIGNNNPFGFQDAFDVQSGPPSFRVSVVEPIEGVCLQQGFVHATVTSGNPRNQQIPVTEVCIKGA